MQRRPTVVDQGHTAALSPIQGWRERVSHHIVFGSLGSDSETEKHSARAWKPLSLCVTLLCSASLCLSPSLRVVPEWPPSLYAVSFCPSGLFLFVLQHLNLGCGRGGSSGLSHLLFSAYHSSSTTPTSIFPPCIHPPSHYTPVHGKLPKANNPKSRPGGEGCSAS
ncbi:hypothetical protein LX32DRAFT_215956 [Colletotrichum zoysiae]|uniref:Uncharacterized protein n=1 Tax=Colletotrichum zoysiae TaxID=1216348 RepID=A0AAD9H4N8_9PEZI|nr:hypothetical protein LX32DRAFT_215956 [Colletotrichum zoysiae]